MRHTFSPTQCNTHRHTQVLRISLTNTATGAALSAPATCRHATATAPFFLATLQTPLGTFNTFLLAGNLLPQAEVVVVVVVVVALLQLAKVEVQPATYAAHNP